MQLRRTGVSRARGGGAGDFAGGAAAGRPASSAWRARLGLDLVEAAPDLAIEGFQGLSPTSGDVVARAASHGCAQVVGSARERVERRLIANLTDAPAGEAGSSASSGAIGRLGACARGAASPFPRPAPAPGVALGRPENLENAFGAIPPRGRPAVAEHRRRALHSCSIQRSGQLLRLRPIGSGPGASSPTPEKRVGAGASAPSGRATSLPGGGGLSGRSEREYRRFHGRRAPSTGAISRGYAGGWRGVKRT